MPKDTLGIIVTIILLTILVSYVIGIFIYDYKRRKKGKVSIFVDSCSCHHEGNGKRLLKAYRKKYGKNSTCQECVKKEA